MISRSWLLDSVSSLTLNDEGRRSLNTAMTFVPDVLLQACGAPARKAWSLSVCEEPCQTGPLEGYPLGWEVYPMKLRGTWKTGQDRWMSPAWERLAAAAKSLQSCPTLYNPIDGSPPGSSVHGIFQARVLEWVAIAFSRFLVYYLSRI